MNMCLQKLSNAIIKQVKTHDHQRTEWVFKMSDSKYRILIKKHTIGPPYNGCSMVKTATI